MLLKDQAGYIKPKCEALDVDLIEKKKLFKVLEEQKNEVQL
jgi:hypothetical protein